jgi:tetratricopeptide (TPR) repeat protein
MRNSAHVLRVLNNPRAPQALKDKCLDRLRENGALGDMKTAENLLSIKRVAGTSMAEPDDKGNLLAELERAVNESPDDPGAYFALACELEKQEGRQKLALETFQKAAKLVKPVGTLPCIIGMHIADLSNPVEAQKFLKTLEASDKSKFREIFYIRKSHGPIDQETLEAYRASHDITLTGCTTAAKAMETLLKIEAKGLISQEELLAMYQGRYASPNPLLAKKLAHKIKDIGSEEVELAIELLETLPSSFNNYLFKTADEWRGVFGGAPKSETPIS